MKRSKPRPQPDTVSEWICKKIMLDSSKLDCNQRYYNTMKTRPNICDIFRKVQRKIACHCIVWRPPSRPQNIHSSQKTFWPSIWLPPPLPPCCVSVVAQREPSTAAGSRTDCLISLHNQGIRLDLHLKWEYHLI